MISGNIKAFLLVAVTVLLGLVSAAILKEASMYEDLTVGMVLLVGGGAALVNGARFVVWGLVHRQYPISISYPLSSLFFPLILILSIYYGEAFAWHQVVAVVMISVGVGILTFEGKS